MSHENKDFSGLSSKNRVFIWGFVQVIERNASETKHSIYTKSL